VRAGAHNYNFGDDPISCETGLVTNQGKPNGGDRAWLAYQPGVPEKKSLGIQSAGDEKTERRSLKTGKQKGKKGRARQSRKKPKKNTERGN